MSLLAIGIVALMGYVWLTRGYYSALIHLVCTLIAGAIAFALWEPASLFLLDFAPSSGFLSFLSGVAWGLGLALPFAVSLAILRIAVDVICRANASAGTAGDYAGGAICGALSGVVASGITVISLGFLRMPPDFLGATLVGYAAKGYIVRTGADVGGLWVPTDAWTVALYGRLSETTFRTAESLAKYHPDLHEAGAALRLNAFEGRNRNTTKPEDFEVVSRFTVGKGANVPLDRLLKDRWNGAAQLVKDVNDQDYPAGSYIEGFTIRFKPGAKEKDGKVTVGAGQLRLVLQNTTDEANRIAVYPIACASQAESSGTMAGRWRFDAANTFITSVGGASESMFAFEFMVPPGFEPTALYVKGVRHVVAQGSTAQPKSNFRGTDERDAFLARIAGGKGDMPGAAGGGSSGGTLDVSKAVKVGNGQPFKEGVANVDGMKLSAGLPFVLQDGTLQSLEISSEGTKEVVGGEETLELGYETKTRGLEKSLRIERFATTADTVLVQLDVGLNSRHSLLGPVGQAASGSDIPVLWDEDNQTYEPIGFVYYDETKIQISFKPGEPVRSMSQLPTLSKSRPAQKLTLLYRVSLGKKIKAFAMGSTAISIFDPVVPCDTPQGRR
ncbi:MAG: hypothetical protein WCK33_11315 [Phycisphaerae bacterium]